MKRVLCICLFFVFTGCSYRQASMHRSIFSLNKAIQRCEIQQPVSVFEVTGRIPTW